MKSDYKFKVGDLVEYYAGGSGSMALGSIVQITPTTFKIYWLQLGFESSIESSVADRALRLVKKQK